MGTKHINGNLNVNGDITVRGEPISSGGSQSSSAFNGTKPSLAGYWRVKQNPTPFPRIAQYKKVWVRAACHTAGGVNPDTADRHVGIFFDTDGKVYLQRTDLKGQPEDMIVNEDGFWADQYQFLIFEFSIKEITSQYSGATVEEFMTWLTASCEKVDLPQIRFVKFFTDEDGYYVFTIENMGGGELLADDSLQICCMRKYINSQYTPKKVTQRLRMMTECQPVGEYNQRFYQIYADPNSATDEMWLFRNNRVSGSDTKSAIYFRFKRVISRNQTSGEEQNAVFSNVVKVYKTYQYDEEMGKYTNLKIL